MSTSVVADYIIPPTSLLDSTLRESQGPNKAMWLVFTDASEIEGIDLDLGMSFHMTFLNECSPQPTWSHDDDVPTKTVPNVAAVDISANEATSAAEMQVPTMTPDVQLDEKPSEWQALTADSTMLFHSSISDQKTRTRKTWTGKTRTGKTRTRKIRNRRIHASFERWSVISEPVSSYFGATPKVDSGLPCPSSALLDSKRRTRRSIHLV